MKLEKAKQLKTIGTAVSLALLLGVGSVNANPPLHSNASNKNVYGEDELFGASVGVSSTCALTEGGTIFGVTTTIRDKSSGDTIPSYGLPMTYVDYIGKMRGPKTITNPYLISGWNQFNPNESPDGDAVAGVVTNTLDLCAARADGSPPSLKDGTVSLNSLTAVYVSNSKGGTSYTSQCKDNPDTDENDAKVVIDLAILDLDCIPDVPSP